LQDERDRLSADCIKVLRRSPFYGHILTAVIKEIDPDFPTIAGIACTPKPTLCINPTEYFKEEEKYRLGILEHELLHIVLKHLIRINQFPDALKANIAADLVCNQLIDPEILSPNMITHEMFDLPPNLSLEEYYELLPELEIDSKDTHVAAKDETQAEIATDRLLKYAESRSQGDIPGNIKELIRYRKIKTINWNTKLQQFAMSTIRSGIIWTKKKESKRYGTKPGTTLDYSAFLLVAIDSSGSITNEEVSMFCGELDKIYRTGKVDVYTVIFDAEIQEIIYPYQKITEVTGRGGTDYRPVFEYAKDLRNHPIFSGIICLTDLCGIFPEHRYPNTLWVTTWDAKTPPFGGQVKLPKI